MARVKKAEAIIPTDIDKNNQYLGQHDVKWDVQKAEVESDVKLEEDYGMGRAVILRRFVFKLPPGLKQTPSKEELFDYHLKHIKAFLWRDELDLVLEPRIVMGKKGTFTIFCTCQPRLGATLHERPQTLTEAANS